MQEVAELIQNYGLSLVLVAYLIFRDYKFTYSLNETLKQIQIILAERKDEQNDVK